MERHLNLVKNTEKQTEKRVLPRFPFSFLTFKTDSRPEFNHAFQVIDLNHTGMQLALKDGGHPFRQNDLIEGEIHWRERSLAIKGEVRWSFEHRLGVEFMIDSQFQKSAKEFLSIDNFVANLRPLHSRPGGVELPSNLKYWLQSDGPLEVFVWRHNDGEISKFLVICMGKFTEWVDGEGLRTGSIARRKDLESPLLHEDEFLLEFDHNASSPQLEESRDIISRVNAELLSEEDQKFLCRKLGA